jgi:hypothetical protein
VGFLLYPKCESFARRSCDACPGISFKVISHSPVAK